MSEEVRMALLGAELYSKCERRNNEVTAAHLEARLFALKEQSFVDVTTTVEDLIAACDLHTSNSREEYQSTKNFTNFTQVIQYSVRLANNSINDRFAMAAFLARYVFGENTVISMEQWITYKSLLNSAPKNVFFHIDHHTPQNKIRQGIALIAANPHITILRIAGVSTVDTIDLLHLHSLKLLEVSGLGATHIRFTNEYSSLTRLVINNDQFNSALPRAMLSLRYLEIRGEAFNQWLPNSLPNVKNMIIESDVFNKSLPVMSRLQTLKIDSHDFNGRFHVTLPGLTRLEIESAVFNRPLPVTPLLQTLKITSPPFNSPVSAQLLSLTRLTIETVEFNQPLPIELPSLLYMFISSRTFNQVLPAMPALESVTILSDAFVPDDNLRGMLPFGVNIAIEPF